jgi:hypothetical protein
LSASKKHGLAPIAALGDMVAQAQHNNGRDPGHACASFNRFAGWLSRDSAIL